MLAVWIVLIIACGVHGMLWQGGVMQHWMKASGYGQVGHRSTTLGKGKVWSSGSERFWNDEVC